MMRTEDKTRMTEGSISRKIILFYILTIFNKQNFAQNIFHNFINIKFLVCK